jgi:hypothetical protein
VLLLDGDTTTETFCASTGRAQSAWRTRTRTSCFQNCVPAVEEARELPFGTRVVTEDDPDHAQARPVPPLPPGFTPRYLRSSTGAGRFRCSREPIAVGVLELRENDGRRVASPGQP